MRFLTSAPTIPITISYSPYRAILASFGALHGRTPAYYLAGMSLSPPVTLLQLDHAI